LHELAVDNHVRVDRGQLLDRVGSISFVALLDDEDHRALRHDVAAILDRHGVGRHGSSIVTPYHTNVVWGRRVD
jgi:hypothetical protein